MAVSRVAASCAGFLDRIDVVEPQAKVYTQVDGNCVFTARKNCNVSQAAAAGRITRDGHVEVQGPGQHIESAYAGASILIDIQSLTIVAESHLVRLAA